MGVSFSISLRACRDVGTILFGPSTTSLRVDKDYDSEGYPGVLFLNLLCHLPVVLVGVVVGMVCGIPQKTLPQRTLPRIL